MRMSMEDVMAEITTPALRKRMEDNPPAPEPPLPIPNDRQTSKNPRKKTLFRKFQPRGIPRRAAPVVQQLVEIANDQTTRLEGLFKLSSVGKSMYAKYRDGIGPSVQKMDDLARPLGYKLALVPIDEDE